MKMLIFCFGMLGITCILAPVNFGGEHTLAGPSIIRQLLGAREPQRLEIIYFPEKIRTRARLSPEMLEKQHRYKLIVADVRSSTVGRDVIASIEAEKFTSPSKQGDFRWGCSFYDEKGEHIASLYFDAAGTVAFTSGQPLASDGRVVKCLRKICNGFRE